MYSLDQIQSYLGDRVNFKTVLRIYEERQWKKRSKEKPFKWEAWMKPDLFPHPSFFCTRLGFVTEPVVCLSRRVQLQHPTHSTCIDCPLGDKIASRTCVGSHGQRDYCPSCPARQGCKSVTGLTKNPMQAISLRLLPGAFPAEENQLAKKSAAPVKNKKNQDVEDEDEDEDIETDEPEEEEDEEEEEADDDDEEEEEEDAPPAKKAKKKGKGGKGNPGNLVPREPIKVGKDILSKVSPEIKKLLILREKTTDKTDLRKIRAKLRSAGFRLSSLSSENPQIEQKVKTDNQKKKAKKKVADEEDDD